MKLCVKLSNQFPFQRIERWALTRGEGTYSRGRLLDIPVSRVGAYSRLGAYSRWRLIEALRYRLVLNRDKYYTILKRTLPNITEIYKSTCIISSI